MKAIIYTDEQRTRKRLPNEYTQELVENGIRLLREIDFKNPQNITVTSDAFNFLKAATINLTTAKENIDEISKILKSKKSKGVDRDAFNLLIPSVINGYARLGLANKVRESSKLFFDGEDLHVNMEAALNNRTITLPIYEAIRSNNWETINTVLDMGAKINIVTPFIKDGVEISKSPLDIALEKREPKFSIILMLIIQGAKTGEAIKEEEKIEQRLTELSDLAAQIPDTTRKNKENRRFTISSFTNWTDLAEQSLSHSNKLPNTKSI